MKPADVPLNNRASLFKQTEPPLLTVRFWRPLYRSGTAVSGAEAAIVLMGTKCQILTTRNLV